MYTDVTCSLHYTRLLGEINMLFDGTWETLVCANHAIAGCAALSSRNWVNVTHILLGPVQLWLFDKRSFVM